MKIEPQRRRVAERFVFFLALCLFTFSSTSVAQDDTRVSATWQVQKYEITATLPQNEADRNLAAKVKLDIKNASSRPASTLTLRISSGAEVSTLAINGAAAEFTKGEEKTGTGSLQRLVVRIPSVAPGSNVTATVDYKLNVKDNSGLAALSSSGSQFLPLSFWYPTPNSWFFARGADYAPFRLQVTAANGVSVVSSGAERAGAFEQTSGGQPFLISGDWERSEGTGGVLIYMPKGVDAEQRKRAGELTSLASEARAFIGGLLGPAPDTPIKIVSVKRGAGFSGGGTILVDEGVFRRGKIDSQTALSIAEGVAKLWIGNSVAVTGDGNGAIREGLSRFVATQFLEGKYGKDVADVERLRQRVAYAAVARRDAPLNIVSPLDDYYFPVVANKGSMIWRLLAQKTGNAEFYTRARSSMQDGNVTLAELRSAFPDRKEFLDYGFDQITETNLQAGLPQAAGGESKIALRNTGPVDVTVDVEAVMANGQRMSAAATVRAKSFGEVSFKTPNKITRVEIDREKLYPQTDYSDDIAPRELTESDPLLAVKRLFDKQEFANAEKTARTVLADFPRIDDVRVLLARSLLALGRTADAEREFKAVLDEKLPTSRSIAWAYVGLSDTAAKTNQTAQALKFAEDAIRADADFGASLAARAIRNRIGGKAVPDAAIAAYFAQFDKAAEGNQKAALDSMVVPGDVAKFAGGIAGQTVQWRTQVAHIDRIDANNVLVEANLTVKLLNRDVESGMAVYRLTMSGGSWKLSAVDLFEVR